MYFRRTLTSLSALRFQKESAVQFIKSSSTKTVTVPSSINPVSKWQPTHGNSFRSFAEYRVKIVNLSPLEIKSGNYISTRTQ
ncbi:hypothetical protein G9P44_005798 [Scheffersomyces stipitis]|nr:hypothetical protein G9P44_005798 [Scheffersomyces stipitis]